MIGTKNNDYSYIDTFIGFLDKIVDIIIKIFNSLGKKSEGNSDAKE